MGSWTKLAVLATTIVLASSCTSGTGTATGSVKAPATSASSPVLMPAGGGDGDSWHDTRGREYRLGLVNTPEYNECYGSEPTRLRRTSYAVFCLKKKKDKDDLVPPPTQLVDQRSR